MYLFIHRQKTKKRLKPTNKQANKTNRIPPPPPTNQKKTKQSKKKGNLKNKYH